MMASTNRSAILDLLVASGHKLRVLLGVLASVMLGACVPVYMLLVARCTTELIKVVFHTNSSLAAYNDTSLNLTQSRTEHMMRDVNRIVIYFTIVGAVAWVMAYIRYWCLWTMALGLGHCHLERVFQHIVHHMTSSPHKHEHTNLQERLCSDVTSIESARGESVGRLCEMCTVYVACLILAFIHSWLMTLMALAFSLLILTAAYLINTKLVVKYTKLELSAYSDANEVVSGALTMNHTHASPQNDTILTEYVGHLPTTVRYRVLGDLWRGLNAGFSYFLFFAAVAALFVYGAKLVRASQDDYVTTGYVIMVTVAVLFATIGLVVCFTDIEAVRQAGHALYRMNQLPLGPPEGCLPLPDNGEVVDSSQCVDTIDDHTDISSSSHSLSLVTQWSVFIAVMKLSRPDWFFIAIGLLAETGVGGFIPGFAVIFSHSLFEFHEESKVKLFAMHFIGFGICLALSWIGHGLMFGVAGARLSRRLRRLAFSSILTHDHSEHSHCDDTHTRLGVVLEIDAARSPGAGGIFVGKVVQCLSSAGAGIVVALYHDVTVTLVILVFIILAYCMHHMQKQGLRSRASHKLSTALRMIDASTGQTPSVTGSGTVERGCKCLDEAYSSQTQHLHTLALTHGFVHASLFFTSAAAFSFGAHQIIHWEIQPVYVLIPYTSVILGVMAARISSSYLPSFTQAVMSAERVLLVISRHGPDRQI